MRSASQPAGPSSRVRSEQAATQRGASSGVSPARSQPAVTSAAQAEAQARSAAGGGGPSEQRHDDSASDSDSETSGA